MKIFSAQDLEYREFSLIEFHSELEALPLINELPKEVKLIDMFSLLNGHFVIFITCHDLKKTFENLRSKPCALDGYFTNDTNVESLQAFYHLNKVNILESIAVIETDKFSKLFELLDLAHKSEIRTLDIKNQRSFNKNTIYLTGSKKQLQDFKDHHQKMVQIQVIENPSETLINALGGR